MLIGDTRSELVHLGEHDPKPHTGTVVWIHPQRRFYVVEFEIGGRKFRESYYFPHIKGLLPEHWNTCKIRLPGEEKLDREYTRNRKKGNET